MEEIVGGATGVTIYRYKDIGASGFCGDLVQYLIATNGHPVVVLGIVSGIEEARNIASAYAKMKSLPPPQEVASIPLGLGAIFMKDKQQMVRLRFSELQGFILLENMEEYLKAVQNEIKNESKAGASSLTKSVGPT